MGFSRHLIEPIHGCRLFTPKGYLMYGMVNRAVKGLVVDSAGTEVWEQVCAKAGLTITDFNDTMVYDDAVTFALVAAASEVLDTPAEEILEGFGRHWILFTGREGWGPLFDIAGNDLRTFVSGLDALHARVQASMPNCRMPSFAVQASNDESLVVEYRSDRDGLAPMVIGLLKGLAEYFGEDWTVGHTGPQGDAEIFVLQPVSADVEEGRAVGVP